MEVHLTMFQSLQKCPMVQCWLPLHFSYSYFNDINKNITSSKLGIFADDCVIYKTIYNRDDGIALQNDLSTLSDWAKVWQMNFNVDKCILLRFTRSHLPIINDYILNNQIM